MPLDQDLTLAAPHAERRAQIDLQLRIGALFIAARHRTIARAEDAGANTTRDRELLACLEAGRQTLIDARQRLSGEADISEPPRTLAA